MNRCYIFKDGTMLASTADRAQAVALIRQYQAAEDHYILRSEYSIIEGKEEFIPYEKKAGRGTK